MPIAVKIVACRSAIDTGFLRHHQRTFRSRFAIEKALLHAAAEHHDRPRTREMAMQTDNGSFAASYRSGPGIDRRRCCQECLRSSCPG